MVYIYIMLTPCEITQRKALRSTATIWLVGGSGWRWWRANPAKCRSLIVRLCSALVYELYATRYIICVCKCGCACLNCLVLINVTSFKHENIYIYIFTHTHVVNTEFHLYRQIYVCVRILFIPCAIQSESPSICSHLNFSLRNEFIFKF